MSHVLQHHYKDMLIYVAVMNSVDRAGMEGVLAAGIDDYLIKPLYPFQVRTRVWVGLRWLQHLDLLHRKLGGSAPPPADCAV